MSSSRMFYVVGPKSGIDLAHIMEQMQPNAAILIVSADAGNEMANFPARAIFLRKPFGSEKLLHAIKQACSQVIAST
jgi:FixJ family two-component response regulator